MHFLDFTPPLKGYHPVCSDELDCVLMYMCELSNSRLFGWLHLLALVTSHPISAVSIFSTDHRISPLQQTASHRQLSQTHRADKMTPNLRLSWTMHYNAMLLLLCFVTIPALGSSRHG